MTFVTEFFSNMVLYTLPMIGGAIYTVTLTFVTGFLSIPLGFIFTLLRVSHSKIAQAITGFYVWVVRGTPLLLQLFFIYFALPYMPFVGQYLVFQKFPAACIAFVFNYAAYFCEIFRGGLLSIDNGQYEAAKVLGFNRYQTLTKIVIPQMVKVVLPAVSNECITLVKDTALIISIGVTEVLYFAKVAVNRDVTPLPLLFAAMLYLLLNLVLTRVFRRLEKRYAY